MSTHSPKYNEMEHGARVGIVIMDMPTLHHFLRLKLRILVSEFTKFRKFECSNRLLLRRSLHFFFVRFAVLSVVLFDYVK